MDHPFHLHGYFFVVLDAKDQPVRPLAWKDTVNIPMKTTTKPLVTFDERPGEWMIHCHILDHADAVPMGTVRVGDLKATGTALPIGQLVASAASQGDRGPSGPAGSRCRRRP